MENRRNLRVGRWGAIVVEPDSGATQNFGDAAAEDSIPVTLRRRMGRLERLAVRCTLGVLDKDGATDELVFCSRHGNVETLAALLRSIAAREPVSPMSFSGSVHNAVPGLVGQIRKERLSHTAIAAGHKTFNAGLIECYARLATEECRDVTLTFADVSLPDPFAAFEDEPVPGIVLALRLGLGSDESEAVTVAPGRAGVTELLGRLDAGANRIALGTLEWSGSAP
jgi:hypothetical protein